MNEALLVGLAISGGEWLAAIGAILAALIALYGVVYTSRQSKRAQQASKEMENKAVDAEAYERARESYEAAIKNYLNEISRLSNRIAELTELVANLEKEKRGQRYDMEALREVLIEARREYEEHMARCQARVERLRDRLVKGQISVDDLDLHLDL